MANIIMQGRKLVGEGLSMVNDFTSKEWVSTLLTSEANKLWRAKILLDRVTRHGPKDKINKEIPNTGLPKIGVTEPDRQYETFRGGFDAGINRALKEQRSYLEPEVEVLFGDGTYPLSTRRSDNDRIKAREQGNNIAIYNLGVSPAQYIILQTVPNEIEFQGESTWAVINSMGRNTPMYHFTGAESVIQMNVSWYCNDKANPQEVVTKCRLLEAWSKANGYTAGPPILKIQWGRSDLFKDQLFILTAATYKLANWRSDAKVYDRGKKSFIRPEGYEDPALYPSTATQELIFRRVSATNLTYDDIVPKSWLDKTQGFGKEDK